MQPNLTHAMEAADEPSRNMVVALPSRISSGWCVERPRAGSAPGFAGTWLLLFLYDLVEV